MAYIKLTQKGNGVVNINALLTEFSYGGVTHKNRSDRYNIPENIWIVDLQYKINNGSWVKKGAISSCDVKLNNGDKLDAWVHYRHDTQGYHHKNSNLPFFYYTDQNGVVADAKSYKTNGACPWIFTLDAARKACKMPNNWTPVGGGKSNTSISWTDWAKSHANTSNNLWWHSGPQHEQRNANSFGSYADGWFSGQGKWNYYRRSCLWKWECKDTASIVCNSSTSPGKPATPTLKVHDAYGANGNVTLTNNDSSNGYMKLGAWLKDGKDGPNIDGTWRWIINGKQGIQASGTGLGGYKWGPKSSVDVNVDFYAVWGEAYEGKEIYYQLSMENDSGIESGYAETYGHHQHFNAKPTIPKVTLTSAGKDNEGNIQFNGSWSAIDPDFRDYSTQALPASLLSYDVVLEVTSPTGTKKTVNLGNKTQTTSAKISSKGNEEGSEYVLKVRSHDGRIYSKDWGYSNKTAQGYGAVTPKIIYPLEDSIVYNTTPRIVIMTEAKGSNDILECKYNNKIYRSNEDVDCFSSSTIPKGKTFMIFRPNTGSVGTASITAKAFNADNISDTSNRVFSVSDLSLHLGDKYIESEDFMNLEKHISNVSNAYGLGEYYTDGAYGYISVEDINVHTNHVVNIDNNIKRLNDSLSPNILTTIKIPGVSYVFSSDYNYIVSDLKNM